MRHEYGHHIANHRSNAPWAAIDWGPKRWASASNVCAKVTRREAYPGDEGSNYALNPGEAWAETYRLLQERKAGITTSTWPIIAPSFYPNEAALRAAELDVVQPWTAPAHDPLDSSVRTGRRRRCGGYRSRHRWTVTTGSAPRCRTAATAEVALVGADRRTVVRRAQVGRPARQAAGRLDLRPALAVRPCDPEGRTGSRPRLGDDAVIRVASVLGIAALVAVGAVSASGSDAAAAAMVGSQHDVDRRASAPSPSRTRRRRGVARPLSRTVLRTRSRAIPSTGST